ncbi:MAG: glycine--tRNA ligase [archaeon]
MISKNDAILNIAANRGFFYPAAEIYKSTAGFWTFGHLGTRVKHNWENLWRSFFLGLSPMYFEIDDCHIMPKKVFESSGHLENFNDPLTECSKCHFRFRADELIEDVTKANVEGLDDKALTKLIEDNKIICPKCQSKLLSVRWFNMMFNLKVGATGDSEMYLRPESAQSPYLAFKREYESLRRKLPMGLAVIGKAYRNEIAPRQGFFRLREFSQAELQIFFDPDTIDDAEDWKSVQSYKIRLADKKTVRESSCKDLSKKVPKFVVYHLAKVQEFYLEEMKVPKEKFRFRELDEKERAFYNKLHFDVEVDFDTLNGFKEVGGVHYRTDHDLKGHQEGSKEKLEVIFNEKRILPHVLELSFGVDRNVWALMDVFFMEEKERAVFNFPNGIAPIEVAVFPLVNKEKLPELSRKIYKDLSKEFKAFYDDSASVGKRYRRQDEVGTCYCVTVDFDSIKKKTVTVRDRDSMAQVVVKVKDLSRVLRQLLNYEISFKKAGKAIKK